MATAKKARTHERIVETAGKALRREGVAGVGVDAVMKEAGLTHGGFYAHFDSRDALIAEAFDRAAVTAIRGLEERSVARAVATGESRAESLATSYLSDRHVAERELGCTLASLGSELPRQSAQVRKVATRRIRDMIAMVQRQLANGANRDADALAATSCLVGALLIARAVDDPALARDVRLAATAAVAGIDQRPARRTRTR